MNEIGALQISFAAPRATARLNSFDLLRLVAALMVLWSHQFAVTGAPEPYRSAFNGRLGVIIFFAISGYLNVQSLLKNPSAWQFLVRRARRIYPALAGLAIFCVALGFAVTTASPGIFWAAVPTFLLKNATVLFGLEYVLPGVFDANPYPSAINGSLWTLPTEIRLYIYLAIVAVAVRYRPALLLAALAAVFAGFVIWFNVTAKNVEIAYFSQFAIVFLTGAMFGIVERIRGTSAAVAVALGLAALTAFTTAIATLPAVALAAILCGKIQPPAWLRPPVDVSYGAYLYAFPVQQLVASYHLPFAPSLAVALSGTMALAVLSAL